MGENRSLDEFVPASDDADDEDVDAAADDTTDETDAERADVDDTDPSGAEQVEADADVSGGDTAATVETTAGSGADDAGDGGTPARVDGSDDPTSETDRPRTTYRWSPDGDDCPVCGETIDRQWRDGDRFVCADCKEW
jgi:hypothetical protein